MATKKTTKGKATPPPAEDVMIDTEVKEEADDLSGKGSGKVHLDPPNIKLIPGNSVSFWAETKGDGRQSVKVSTARDTWIGKPSVNGGVARTSKILETAHGEITVTFYEDGKAYASGKFPV